MRAFLLLLAVSLGSTWTLSARTWTQAATGKEIVADLIKVEDGKVHLKLEDGRVGQVDVISLSLADQEYIREIEAQSMADPAATHSGSSAGEWPNFRGPNFDGISTDTGLLDSWPEEGPEKLWVYEDAGMGYSGVAISGGKLFTIGTRGDELTVVCVDISNGEEVWATEIGTDDQQGYNAGWGHGPRATPTVSDGHVYVLGPKGTLACLSVEEGKPVWDKDLVKDFGGNAGGWGYSESPFVDGDKVVIGPGGSSSPVVALDKTSGSTIWSASGFDVGKEKAEYANIVPLQLNEKLQYLRLFSNQLVSLDSESGDVLWMTGWPGEDTPAVIPTPIADGNEVLIASGYGVGSKLVSIDSSNQPSDVWQEKTLKIKHGGMIKFGDHVYGSSEGEGLVCLDWKTGELAWNEKGQFFGSTDSVAIADGMIYVLNDSSGTLSLVEASPDGFEQKGQFTIDPQSSQRNPKGKVWTYPVVTGGKLYLRDQEYIIAYDVSAP
ncbi:MAG: PQQ-binding-like beta-propeller repeat protein [Verrucomicrobiota bacterium]